MRATLTDGREVVISFSHHSTETLFFRPHTVCVLEYGNAKKRRIAMLSPKDNYCKETGRKVSLARALKGFSREDRKRIWKAYHGRRNFVHAGHAVTFDGREWSVTIGKLVLHAPTRAGIMGEVDSLLARAKNELTFVGGPV